MLKIRRPLGRLILNMGIAIPGKTVFLIVTAPRPQWVNKKRNLSYLGHWLFGYSCTGWLIHRTPSPETSYSTSVHPSSLPPFPLKQQNIYNEKYMFIIYIHYLSLIIHSVFFRWHRLENIFASYSPLDKKLQHLADTIFKFVFWNKMFWPKK